MQRPENQSRSCAESFPKETKLYLGPLGSSPHSLSTLVRRHPPTSRAPPRPRSKWRKDEPRTFEEYRAYYVDEAWKAEYSGYPAKARPEDLYFVNRELDGDCLARLGYERFELPIPDAAGSPGASGGGGGAKPKAKKKTTATATGAERRRPWHKRT